MKQPLNYQAQVVFKPPYFPIALILTWQKFLQPPALTTHCMRPLCCDVSHPSHHCKQWPEAIQTNPLHYSPSHISLFPRMTIETTPTKHQFSQICENWTKACSDRGICARDNIISSIVYIHHFTRVISMNSICAIKQRFQKQAGTSKPQTFQMLPLKSYPFRGFS